ncbi:methenyltetrahydromethanopterin cyclohydrolase [Halapricum sp. CBA1109]|uniref:methenyltetrahydromethanopterin cyclohydrolase n=1 Tax=Halapricum sp. CBA1109 TaxID=2668068 RepID=UPI0012F78E9F|nr:methenyltetrahydromethanopterin cyclohydrolase [Halapricum sp. CBA1109]MUV90003.1 methenyltetrahydromethanopterin cyclohydrolase [Halapricum sp. CBA1109]
MEALNRMATDLVDEAIDFAEELTLEVGQLETEATVVDFGVGTPGGVEAGLMLAEIQTAGLATVQSNLGEVAGTPRTHVELSTDYPGLALLGSQKAGWEVTTEEFEGLGSGPARALVAEEEEFGRLGYREEFDFAVLAIESDQLPDEAVAAQVAEMAGVPESGVFLPAYASASITGSVNAAARAAELATFRLSELGYDPLDILSAHGRAPVAPVADSEDAAMAATTDALAYGGRAHLTVESEFDRFEEVASTAADTYGDPMADVFESVDWEMAEIDTSVFAPAQVTIDVRGGSTYTVGETHEDVLAESFED